MGESVSRFRYRSVATTAAVALTLLLGAAAGCDSRQEPELPSVQEKLRESHIWGQPVLRIGVAEDEPLMGEVRNGVHVGFDVEIARYIAASLGYVGDHRIEFVSVSTEDRIPALQGGIVDLVVSSFSITEDRKKHVSFAGPYFVTTQEVLIPTRHRDTIRTIEDLRNPKYKICTSGGSTSEAELEEHQVPMLVVKDVRDCVKGIRAGRYDAVSSDLTILAGFMARHPKDFEIVDMPFGTSELLGVGVPIGDPALRDLVAYFLHKSYQQGLKGEASPWQTAYNRTLGPWLRVEKRQPPPLDVPELVDFDDKVPQR
ncbi:glutamate transport system substrate-binding protein [Micromonospora phaseoli]|uniref:Glutamate transport system substrate-binding protein n=1 Tax=Micromonospora phaseoli TaxID=1144548 RepID=A0A1H7DDG5_9ACTN|nr:transporter substrate-binding domain-containing protein [Micromonospora phaseoli]PZV90541.1 glutamate transport system substrate-binding protein [Micromonospora phaseoli]GIJ78068.1 glutamate ABC transporter substrate-binding protein [Micromonospora phaseoli]SEJ99756.1 glutamate transport system substrate-binding protein [Micromonospora phaseoli]